jgi:C-terminal processing protease CtpA/Prc
LPGKNNYKGKVYFLINGKSFSTTAEFCAIAKSNNRGKFIGEETGGGYYGNTSGARTTITLPNSKIKVNIPLHKYVMAVKKANHPDRGVIPDYIVSPGINEAISDKDVQLNYAMSLIEK